MYGSISFRHVHCYRGASALYHSGGFLVGSTLILGIEGLGDLRRRGFRMQVGRGMRLRALGWMAQQGLIYVGVQQYLAFRVQGSERPESNDALFWCSFGE